MKKLCLITILIGINTVFAHRGIVVASQNGKIKDFFSKAYVRKPMYEFASVFREAFNGKPSQSELSLLLSFLDQSINSQTMNSIYEAGTWMGLTQKMIKYCNPDDTFSDYSRSLEILHQDLRESWQIENEYRESRESSDLVTYLEFRNKFSKIHQKQAREYFKTFSSELKECTSQHL